MGEVAAIDAALTPDGFDPGRILELIDASAIDPAQKAPLKALVSAASDDVGLRASVLEQVRAALR